MTSPLQLVYDEAQSGLWAHWDFTQCPCLNGWLLSGVDTWHKCRFHFDKTLSMHPEDDLSCMSEEEYVSNVEAYRTRQLRNTYARYADLAKIPLKEMTRRVMQMCDKTDPPERMIAVARDIHDSEQNLCWSKDGFV